jgi:hypothetical protein
MDEQPTKQAIRECAEWLAMCRQIGWTLEELDFLEALWWKYHDPRGRLIQAHPIVNIVPPNADTPEGES